MPAGAEEAGDGLLGLAADVAGQDDRDVAPEQFQDDRVVVADVLPFPVGKRRVADDHLDVVDREPIVRLESGPSGARARAAAARRTLAIGADRGTGMPSEDLARPEVAHDRQEAADVIRVAVRDGGRIEAPDAVVTQDGADDAVADVEGGRSRQSAGIDEQRRASGKPDQRGIALPHVHEGHVQRPVAARRDQARRLEEDPGRCGNARQRGE